MPTPSPVTTRADRRARRDYGATTARLRGDYGAAEAAARRLIAGVISRRNQVIACA